MRRDLGKRNSINPRRIPTPFGVEQQLIEANGGAQSQGGTSSNAINGVAESNPNRANYMNAAEAEFGAAEAGEPLTGIEP
jgi:hypothetical protein